MTPSGRIDLDPAEHDVARRLREALALDDPLAAGWRTRCVPRNGSSTDGWASLNCRNSGSLVVAAEHQADPGAGADAADADDLAGRVDVAEALEQLAPVARERAPVGADDTAEELLDPVRVLGGDLLDRDDQRRIADDAGLAVDHLGQLRRTPSMLSLVRPLATFASSARTP